MQCSPNTGASWLGLRQALLGGPVPSDPSHTALPASGGPCEAPEPTDPLWTGVWHPLPSAPKAWGALNSPHVRAPPRAAWRRKSSRAGGLLAGRGSGQRRPLFQARGLEASCRSRRGSSLPQESLPSLLTPLASSKLGSWAGPDPQDSVLVGLRPEWSQPGEWPQWQELSEGSSVGGPCLGHKFMAVFQVFVSV